MAWPLVLQWRTVRSVGNCTDGPAGKLVARWIRVISTLGSGVIRSGGGSTDAYDSGTARYGMTMDVMDVANAGTTDSNAGATDPTKPTSGTRKCVGGNSHNRCAAE
ncbi:hypothetical protein SAMN05216525_13551 [Bradyrhizobium sp. Gha]|nr:hypothetical protein SAMN05216525_13551 [Bradyrhizobium sp. Gha]